MKKTPLQKKTTLLFEQPKNELKAFLKAMDWDTLKNYLDVSDALAKTNYERFQTFNEQYKAIEAYTGAQYKALDYETLSTKTQRHVNKNVLIISGLYGLLRPTDTIAHYRLPMALKYISEPLHGYWKKLFSTLEFTEPIINLASQEYSDALPPHWDVIEIKFMSAPSMLVKKLRGLFVREVATNSITKRDELKQIVVDGFTYNPKASTSNQYVFTKK